MASVSQTLAIFMLCALPLLGQSSTGELRLRVTDPDGLAIKASAQIASDANQLHRAYVTDETGALTAHSLPFGRYRLRVEHEGFSPYDGLIEIRSALPTEYRITLNIATLSTAVNVAAESTLLDPNKTTSLNRIEAQTIADRPASLPGRSLVDLVNSQPGWLYEGNAVLHPRGSEYQTQFVVDGVPLIDNRSPSFGPEIEADDVDSLAIYTAGIPAEYGRKMGGVVEVNTLHDAQPGWHGEIVFSGGSFDTAGATMRAQFGWNKNVVGASASGNMTAHYLNPVVPENYTNRGTMGDFSLDYEREITARDRLTLGVRHELARFEIPNEQIQESDGQLQTAGNFETMGIVSYQHIFSSDVLANLRGMVRAHSHNLSSNATSWPIEAFQDNSFNEGYFNSAISIHRGRHEWKTGIESDAMFLNENFSYNITAHPSDPYYPFDPGTPRSLPPFHANRPDLEPAAFVEDLIRLGKWTLNAGLRWDHHQLLVNQNALSPRLSMARYFPSANLIVHASYDRVFQTPAFENILLSSSPKVESFNSSVLRLPVEPSHGNYFELGATKSFFNQLRVDANYFRRDVNNYADDDQLLNTAVSFPVAFRKAVIYGVESKIEVPHWGRFSGFLSYSYNVGNAWFPVTGGLFLGEEVVNAKTELNGHFSDSQDQRHTVRARIRYNVTSRLWFASGTEYGSGLPFDFNGTSQQALAEYGPAVVGRVGLNNGRIKPALMVEASFGADLYKKEHRSLRLQGDVENISNRLDVIDFGGLFSGNAIGPARSYWLRLAASF